MKKNDTRTFIRELLMRIGFLTFARKIRRSIQIIRGGCLYQLN